MEEIGFKVIDLCEFVISTVITDPEGLSALPSIIPQKLGRQTKPSPDRYGFATNPLVTVKMVQVLKPAS